MKKFLRGISSLLTAALLFTAATTATAPSADAKKTTTIKIEATQVPHAEILNKIKPTLKKQGIILNVIVVNDYVKPNLDVDDGTADANFFQHIPYLDDFNKKRGTKLVSAGGVHVEPIGLYSNKVKSISKIAKGATIAIPNDSTNGGRALLLLQKQGLIKLKNPKSITSTERDIVKNPKNLKFKALDAAMLPRTLDQVDAAVINSNYALEAKLNPTKDSIAIEDKDSPYVNIVAVKKGNENKPAIKKLIKALQSKEVKNFINTKYKGAVVPAF